MITQVKIAAFYREDEILHSLMGQNAQPTGLDNFMKKAANDSIHSEDRLDELLTTTCH